MSQTEQTREELIAEIDDLRRRVVSLEALTHKNRSETTTEKIPKNQVAAADILIVDSEAFRKMFKEHSAVMYIVDLSTFSIIDANKAALNFYGYDLETMLTKRIPDLNITPEPAIRAEVKLAVEEGRSYYVFKHRLASGENRDVEIYANPISIQGKEYSFSVVHDITEHKKSDEQREHLIAELQTTLDELKTLRGIIPICMFCKKVRDDQGFWNQVEVYLKKHSEADFSHALCPECASEHYAEYYNE